jgi:hypothetical protein
LRAAASADSKGTTTLAALASLANQTDTSLAVPAQIVVPTTGTLAHKIQATFSDADAAHALLNMTTATLTCVNAAGTSRSSRISGPTNPSTGVYQWTYTSTAGDAQEALLFNVIGTKSGDPGQWQNAAAAQVVDQAIEQFTAGDRAALNAAATQSTNAASSIGSANSTLSSIYDELGTVHSAVTINNLAIAANNAAIGAIEVPSIEDITGGIRTELTPELELIADNLDDKVSNAVEAGGGVIAGPVFARLPAGIELRGRQRIAVAQFSALRQSINVYDVSGELVNDVADRVLKFVIFDENGTGIAVIEDDDIDRDSAAPYRIYVNIPTTATGEAGKFLWQFWDVSVPSKPQDFGRGPFVVEVSCLALA